MLCPCTVKRIRILPFYDSHDKKQTFVVVYMYYVLLCCQQTWIYKCTRVCSNFLRKHFQIKFSFTHYIKCSFHFCFSSVWKFIYFNAAYAKYKLFYSTRKSIPNRINEVLFLQNILIIFWISQLKINTALPCYTKPFRICIMFNLVNS